MDVCFNTHQRAAFENMAKVLKAAGTSLENVVKVNVYLTNFDRDFVPMNEVYSQVPSIDDRSNLSDLISRSLYAVLWIWSTTRQDMCWRRCFASEGACRD